MAYTITFPPTLAPDLQSIITDISKAGRLIIDVCWKSIIQFKIEHAEAQLFLRPQLVRRTEHCPVPKNSHVDRLYIYIYIRIHTYKYIIHSSSRNVSLILFSFNGDCTHKQRGSKYCDCCLSSIY